MPNGDPFKLVKQGDRLSIPAVRHNGWQRAAQYVANQRNQSPGAVGGGLPEGLILVLNNSGSDVGQFGILGISGVVVEPTDNLGEFEQHYALTGVTPTSAHVGKFVVANAPIANGSVGQAWIFGTCPVQIGSGDVGAADLDVLSGSTLQLQTTSGGIAQVLWSGPTGASASSTETGYRAVIRFGGAGSALPVGQYQYQLYGMVSTNQTGFTYALAHAMTPTYNGSSGS